MLVLVNYSLLLEQSNWVNPTAQTRLFNTKTSKWSSKTSQTQKLSISPRPPTRRGTETSKMLTASRLQRSLASFTSCVGLLAFSSELHVILNGSPRNFSIGAGIWTSVFFVVSGGLSIGGARSGSKCLVVSTMEMSIISAVCAGGLLIASSIG